ncbi:c-type cytochrome [Roseomonas sp. NAR14]|uniref:C-type cytochrome n=1 Tax=Roseomonas acroporae TaxID=2937791 RepID=A0A9X2BWD2_9PROT|nr:c-type cytochrome [Roseomonas acroporae]MCK8787557.1 c-type cytochrome [Roseomonas acroporae]
MRHLVLPAAFTILLAQPSLAADADHGKVLFQRQCAACHQVATPRNGVGPSLLGVTNRPAGTAEGFGYSPALKGSGLTWTAENLDAYLANPGGRVPGTRMPTRVANDADRADIVAFLQQGAAPN